MTNSRLTDPEILELRFPVVVEEFSIRQDSGGKGKKRGGNGVIRKIRFLEPMIAGILSNRRRVFSFGIENGGSGKVGKNYIKKSDTTVEKLGSQATVEINRGDTFIIETPGGGGYGEIDN